jgi:predicted permease
VTTLLQDLRYGVRMSLKSPGLTLAAVLTLAVGIAANTTVFSWIDAILLRPLPGIANSAEVVSFESVRANGEPVTTSYPDYRDYRDHLNLLAGLAMARPDALSIGEEDHAELVWGQLVSGNLFAVLGVKPLCGRVFSPDEYGDKQGGYPVAVISYGLWNRRFHRDPHVAGQTIRVNRQQLTIIGVTPQEFRGTIPGLSFEMWVPLMMGPQLNTMPDWMLKDRQTRNLAGLARLPRGVTLEQARSEIRAVALELARMDPGTNQGIGATVLPVWKGHFGAQGILLGPLQILMAVCGVVLLIVCANVANLLLARSMSRQPEFALRIALGAGRLRLARQLLTESLVLAVLGALAGMPLAMWMVRSLGYLVPPSGLPVVLDVRMNGDILAFTILVCVAVCILAGIAPALQSARTDLNDALKQSGRAGGIAARPQRVRSALVVSEVALALVAIVGAGLFAKSFRIARQIHPGFEPRNVLVSYLYLSTAGYSVPDRKLFCQRLRQRLESQPGITAAVYADYIPLGFDFGPWEPLRVDGYVPGIAENMQIYRNVVAPGYFNLLGIPILDGRDFTEQDDLKSQPVMIVNEAFVQRFFGGRYAIGRRVYGWGKWFTVAGVAKNSKYHTPSEATLPYFYVPFRQVYRADLAIAFYVRASGDLNQALRTMRDEVRSMDGNVGMFFAMPLTEFITASLFPQKMAATLLSALGLVALVLAAVGLYSVMAYSIAQRTQEIGIRMALGARSSDVLGLVVRQGMGLALAGLLVGMAAAVAVTRLASPLLVNVSATDPFIFSAAAFFLAIVALAATYVPARRAAHIDPNEALRRQ